MDEDILAGLEAMRKTKQLKKKSNLTWSTQKLIDEGVRFESKNKGIHLIVKNGDSYIDFYPSTGKFINRENKKHGRGVHKLIKLVKGGSNG